MGMAQVSQAGTGLLYVLDASHRWPNAPVEGGWGPAPGRGGGPGDLPLEGSSGWCLQLGCLVLKVLSPSLLL